MTVTEFLLARIGEDEAECEVRRRLVATCAQPALTAMAGVWADHADYDTAWSD